MARFAAKKTSKFETSSSSGKASDAYEHGYSFPTDDYYHISRPGLDTQTVDEIASIKGEPDWMRSIRQDALTLFQAKPIPTWGANLLDIDYNAIHYYLRPTEKQVTSWDQVPPEVKATFDRLGIPQAEREVLAGVKAQYDSEIVYGSVLKSLEDQGVIFLSMDEGLAKYPDLVRQYFGKVIPAADNKFSALNTAAWSGGSFVYVPPGVEVTMPLQTYFRINSSNAGQFERTLIIVDEGAKVHYVEGCFVAGTRIQTAEGLINIEDITTDDLVLTHTGVYKSVGHTQVRKYTGKLYKIQVTGNPSEIIEATEEHPFLVVPRKYQNDRNKNWQPKWLPIKEVKPKDYVCIPIDQTLKINQTVLHQVLEGRGRHGFKLVDVAVPSTKEFFRLVGYYLAEGSISSGHYLNFSFGSHEREYIEDVKSLLKQVFSEDRVHESHHKANNGTSVVVRSTKLCRIFEQFGTAAKNKQIPVWMMQEAHDKQQQLILGWFRGDGNYYCRQNKYGLKEVFRISTISETLAYQGRQLLARLGMATSINKQIRKHEMRQDMYTLVIGGEYIITFGKLVGQEISNRLNQKKRATSYFLDEKYLYAPITNIEIESIKDVPVYNFSVEEDESYVAGGIAVHNCTAPNFSSNSLHAAVVEIFVKKGARCQYTTVQNWYKNVYNLVTKRAWVEEEAEMVWTDFNMGSKVTMKYPGFILAGKGARGETLSMALAGAGQHQDTGSKAIHLAPHTSSTIISKSISKDGGRTSYRGLVQIGPQAHHSKNVVICDALLLDDISRSDTYPVDRIMNSKVSVQHEASVSKIGEEQLFYLMSRGISEEDSQKMIVNGFIDDLVKKLPLEYAVEMNRLIDHEMEGSIG